MSSTQHTYFTPHAHSPHVLYRLLYRSPYRLLYRLLCRLPNHTPHGLCSYAESGLPPEAAASLPERWQFFVRGPAAPQFMAALAAEADWEPPPRRASNVVCMLGSGCVGGRGGGGEGRGVLQSLEALAPRGIGSRRPGAPERVGGRAASGWMYGCVLLLASLPRLPACLPVAACRREQQHESQRAPATPTPTHPHNLQLGANCSSRRSPRAAAARDERRPAAVAGCPAQPDGKWLLGRSCSRASPCCLALLCKRVDATADGAWCVPGRAHSPSPALRTPANPSPPAAPPSNRLTAVHSGES